MPTPPLKFPRRQDGALGLMTRYPGSCVWPDPDLRPILRGAHDRFDYGRLTAGAVSPDQGAVSGAAGAGCAANGVNGVVKLTQEEFVAREKATDTQIRFYPMLAALSKKSKRIMQMYAPRT